ncbi:helix-turn-helix domain-containing protein [Lentzea sp. NBC_00516]|uniref:helix-turn-helix domain-containing protein n=1 Tax=Lentzea sp. NBC_00516 TaxID=2903582 RepID=UPI002E813A81|nr:helix-turn-helix domain-containing protein [Lentzea sp. NBC_00516]WUD23178.1 helix-turn-helix domain-containing protein [Lentzea sp. NBC_00516]
MSTTTGAGASPPTFYTVPEAAQILRVDAATIYRAIRENSFPAIRLRTRYVVPARAVEELAKQASDTGGVVDVAKWAADQREFREYQQRIGGVW